MPWLLRTDKRRWLILATGALALVWVVAPAAVPMYDSCCTPDEPYRYVHAPPGSRDTPAPSLGRSVLNFRDGHVKAEYVNTAEVGPQASLYVPAGALVVPAGAGELTVTVTPEAAPADAPPDGHVAGNVYRIAAVADAQPVPLRGGAERPSLQLRAPSSQQPGPVFERHDAAGWHRAARTTRTGIDVYETQISALGDWALVQVSSSRPSNRSGINAGLLVAGVVVLVATGLVLGLRFNRREQSP